MQFKLLSEEIMAAAAKGVHCEGGQHMQFRPQRTVFNKFLHSTVARIGFVAGSIILLLANPAAAAGLSITAAVACTPPEGSWKKTCRVVSQDHYYSPDPHLHGIPFCEFYFECKQVEWGNLATTRRVMAQKDVGCLAWMENCDGVLVPRSGDDRHCIDQKAATQEAENHKSAQNYPTYTRW